MLQRLTQVLAGARSTDLHECRHCGTAVSPLSSRCPNCDSTEIAAYDLS